MHYEVGEQHNEKLLVLSYEEVVKEVLEAEGEGVAKDGVEGGVKAGKVKDILQSLRAENYAICLASNLVGSSPY